MTDAKPMPQTIADIMRPDDVILDGPESGVKFTRLGGIVRPDVSGVSFSGCVIVDGQSHQVPTNIAYEPGFEHHFALVKIQPSGELKWVVFKRKSHK